MDIKTSAAVEADVFLAGLASQWMQQPSYQSEIYDHYKKFNEKLEIFKNYEVLVEEHHGVDQAKALHHEGGNKFKDNPNIDVHRDGNFRKKRQRRWGPEKEVEDKKRNSRWATELPKVNPWLGQIQMPDLDPELQALHIKLFDLNQKLQTNMVFDDGIRSPSPEPLYDNMGIRINTRESRAREKLTVERQKVISMLIKKDPAFKAPADYKSLKYHKKLYIPVKEYPGYNFMGLIIGPRGNTQKQMEKETGAKIVIRGKGSVKEGSYARKRMKHEPSENEDLHVLVEADTEDAVEKAVVMVEKLLVPVEGLNEHKQAQLRFLPILNGTRRDGERCRHCGEHGHMQYSCATCRHSTFKSDVLCRTCGNGSHPTIDCPLKGSAQSNKLEDEINNFLAELGEGGLDGIRTASLVGNGGGGCEVHSSQQSSHTLVLCKPQRLPPPQLQRSMPPWRPLAGGGHYMTYPSWIASHGPMQQYNPYGPLPPGSNSSGPLPNSYFTPQGQGYHEAPFGQYGGPYNNYTSGPPPHVYANNSATWGMPRS